MHIYVSLLKQMAPEHLLATSAKLCAEILASASDGMLNIDDVPGQCVLQVRLLFILKLTANFPIDISLQDDESIVQTVHILKFTLTGCPANFSLQRNASSFQQKP